MPTTGGALARNPPRHRSHADEKLRQAGAIIIAKTNMTELANWIAAG